MLLFVDCCISHRGDLSRSHALCEAFLEEFKKRAPAFLATLPGAMDGLKEDQLAKALANAMTASAMNSTLPPSFWKTSPLSRTGSRDS